MATPAHTTSRRKFITAAALLPAIIALPAAAAPSPAQSETLDYDAGYDDAMGGFVVIWYAHWRSLGNDVMPRLDGNGVDIYLSCEDVAFPLGASSDPSLQAWDQGRRDGMSRGLLALLTDLPGAREELERAIRLVRAS